MDHAWQVLRSLALTGRIDSRQPPLKRCAGFEKSGRNGIQMTAADEKDRSRPARARRAALGLVTSVLAVILSLPAALYLWQRPDATNVLSLLLTLGLFFAILTLVRSVWLQILIGLPVLLLNLIEIVHIMAFGGLISLGGVEAVFYVDPHEAREFATEHGGLFVLGLLVVMLFCALAYAKRRLDDLRFGRRLLVGAVSLFVPFGLLTTDLMAFGSKRDVYLPTRILDHYAAYLGVNPLTHTISGIVAAWGERKELENLQAAREKYRFNARLRAGGPDRETYILVVGESSRRQNWSLFGYGRPTNPRLATTPGLVAFGNALSPATTTGRSLPLSFSFATAEHPDLFYTSKSFVSGFREAGFKTFWITNQGTQRTAVGNQIALIMGEAEDIQSTNFGFWNTVLDEEMLPDLDKALADPAQRKLIVVHCLGSHTNYRQRYPDTLVLGPPDVPVRQAHDFADITDAEAETIDEYDKTIAYTDWLLETIIERHRATGTYGAVVYFSDHGQRLYDDASKKKGHGFRGFKHQDAEIPLLAWTSDAFNAANPKARAAIRANATAPVSTANLAASMLDLARIDYDGMDSAASFFNPDFSPAPRKVLTTDGKIIDYDTACPVEGQPCVTSSIR